MQKYMPREDGQNNALAAALQFAYAELMVICELEVNPWGRMHINRLLSKLP
jgi:hypothetical protein